MMVPHGHRVRVEWMKNYFRARNWLTSTRPEANQWELPTQLKSILYPTYKNMFTEVSSKQQLNNVQSLGYDGEIGAQCAPVGDKLRFRYTDWPSRAVVFPHSATVQSCPFKSWPMLPQWECWDWRCITTSWTLMSCVTLTGRFGRRWTRGDWHVLTRGFSNK